MNILTYNTLFRGDMDLKPVPELVDIYENTSDTEWVFHLRQGVKFHDGSEMTADDVVASIEYAKTCPEVNLYNGSVAACLSTTAEGNYTAAIGNYSASNMLSYLTGVYHSKSIGASNKTRLNNPEVDALIDQACAAIDEAEREAVLRQCSTLINELCPQVPLFQDVYLRAYNANLEGVEINAAGFLYFNDVKWKE